MSKSYKTLYLDLMEEHLKLSRLATDLMVQHLKDVKSQEVALADSASKLQTTMAAMASSLTEKIKAKKEGKSQTPGTGIAK